MRLIYLKEGRHYTVQGLATYVQNLKDSSSTTESNEGGSKLDATSFDERFFERLQESINKEFDKSVVKGKNGVLVFHYVGLYDYVDEETGKNLTFFFLPKFLDIEEGDETGEDEQVKDDKGWNSKDNTLLGSWKACCDEFETFGRDILIQAIDRYSKDDVEIVDQVETSEKSHKGILELAVRFLRDYLEKGLYIVQRHELELNGRGEIDWQTTIDEFQPLIKKGRPYYMDVKTELAYSDEDHYITRLQKCLVTTWGRKLEELGLSSVLRVNVPLLSEEQLDQLGDDDFKIAQINRELNVQFVTKSRETLALMKELIQRSAENKAANYESLSFGMTGVHALWEKACAEVLGSELDEKICECGMHLPQGEEFKEKTFKDYMPCPIWSKPDEGDKCKAKGWQLDFIRTWSADGHKKLVILDAKYYSVFWPKSDEDSKRTIKGQPGMADITKQMFYQMAFQELQKANPGVEIVNAFLFPAVDSQPSTDDGHTNEKGKEGKVTLGETVRIGWPTQVGAVIPTKAFKEINLFAVRIPGLHLLERYANYTGGDDGWFGEIVKFADEVKFASKTNKDGEHNEQSCLHEGEDTGG